MSVHPGINPVRVRAGRGEPSWSAWSIFAVPVVIAASVLWWTGIIHLDYHVTLFFNHFVHRSWTLDTLLLLFASSPLLRGGPIALLIWWAWFTEGKQQRQNREVLLYGIIACLFALLVARSVAHVLPFRLRPIHNPGLGLQLAQGLSASTLMNWSSFPSDHAALFFTLATTLWLVSRSLGALAIAHTFFVVALPRVFLGLHYSSDILGGMVIGVSMAILGRSERVRGMVARPALQWIDRSPKHFYTAFFFATYMIGMVFDPVPPLLRFSATVARTAIVALRISFLTNTELFETELALGLTSLVIVLCLLVILVQRPRARIRTGSARLLVSEEEKSPPQRDMAMDSAANRRPQP